MSQLVPITADNVQVFPPTGDDITFTHSVFAQCFLPLRKLKGETKRYQVRHGNALLVIRAGDLINPETKEAEEQEVPYGSAARIALAHIHNHIARAKSLDEAIEIPMGRSLRRFFEQYQLSIGGKNGKQIEAQIRNIAAAHITIGVWTADRLTQKAVPQIAEEIDFWLEQDDRQRTLWQPTMIVNPKYAEAIRERTVPLDMRALVGLYQKPRAMDIFTWFSYRLPRITDPKGVFVPYFTEQGIQSVLGATLRNKTEFRRQFIAAIQEVVQWYPTARVRPETDGIRLFPSPSPIPPEHSLSSGKSHFLLPTSK